MASKDAMMARHPPAAIVVLTVHRPGSWVRLRRSHRTRSWKGTTEFLRIRQPAQGQRILDSPKLREYHIGQAVQPRSCRDAPISASKSPGVGKLFYYTQVFCIPVQDPNLHSHAYRAATLLTESSLHCCASIFFYEIYVNFIEHVTDLCGCEKYGEGSQNEHHWGNRKASFE